MRYHHERPDHYTTMYGTVYICDHPAYSRCTLYRIGDRGLAVIQQRYDIRTKHTYWTEIDPWLTDEIYLHVNFRQFFNDRGGPPSNGIFPTVTVRQIMWSLRMLPLPKEQWETVFDRKDI